MDADSSDEGLDTDKPYLQLGCYTFQGQYKDAMGTRVLFQKHETEEKSDNEESTKHTDLKYFAHTHKVLQMDRVILKKKPTQTEESSETVSQSQSEMEVDNDVNTSVDAQQPESESMPDSDKIS